MNPSSSASYEYMSIKEPLGKALAVLWVILLGIFVYVFIEGLLLQDVDIDIRERVLRMPLVVLFGYAGIIAFITGYVMYRRNLDSVTWASAAGLVIDSTVGDARAHKPGRLGGLSSQMSSRTLYMPIVRYEYTVKGVRYEAERIAISEDASEDRASAELVAARYPKGSEVIVYHSPHAPEEAVIERQGVSRRSLVVGSVAGSGLILFSLFLLMLIPPVSDEDNAYLDMKPFLEAARDGDLVRVTRFLENRAGIRLDLEVDETTVLVSAIRGDGVKKGNIEVVRHLLSKGADASYKLGNGSTPLMHAIWSGRDDMARLLIDHRAEIDAADNDGNTALIEAASERPETARLLIEKGADVHHANRQGKTALMMAVAGQVGTVRLLLEKGADTKPADEDGWIALHYAIYHDKTETVRLLISHGADMNARTNDGKTPLAISKENDNKELAGILIGAGARE